ncbi:MAG: hypothetical protein ABIQ86_04375 [Steroidobacteraceae bacterium]
MSQSPALTMPPADAFAAEVERIRASNLFGRATQMQRMFEFLVTCQAAGRVPKEMEVAVDGLGRGVEFDVAQDATVRVAAHKLRKRLDEFYRDEATPVAARLTIPRGEYRLTLQSANSGPAPAALFRWRRLLPANPRERVAAVLIGVLLLACGALLLAVLSRPTIDGRLAAVRNSPLWAPLLSDDLPVQLVLGDYFIFGERGEAGDIRRLVRDFNVNSAKDLEQVFIADPTLTAKFADLNLGYLPTSSAQALREVLPILVASGKHVSLTLASELDPSTIKTSHIVYIGYLSALGMLMDVAMAQSRYSFAGSYDELIDSITGNAWVSEAGESHAPAERYRDFAYLASFRGPGGNQHLVIAGTRDTGLMQAAESAVDITALQALAARKLPLRGFEALYEVQSVNGVNVEARLIDASATGQ